MKKLPAGLFMAVVLLLCRPIAMQGQEADSKVDGAAADTAESIADQLADSGTPGEKSDQAGIFLKGEALEQYRRLLQNRDAPAYSVTRVLLEGKIVSAGQDERAELTATIQVQVNRTDEAVEVPLNLNEATLTDHHYKGPGTATPASNFDRQSGYRWWLQGKGNHQLTLSLLVPVNKQLSSRRLALTIPATAVSRLQLDIPSEAVAIKAVPQDAWVKTTAAEGGTTKLQMYWFGTRLDLSWQPFSEREPARAVLQSMTFIKVEPTTESVILRATTRLQALEGSFSEVRVRLPADFELLVVEGKHYANHEVTAGNQATVTLTGPVSGSELVELKWTLEHKGPFPKNPGTLTVDGFEVHGARRQTGEIAVSSLEGFRISRREGADRKVYRKTVSAIAAAEGIFTAYEFYGQPFRLVLEIEEIEPRYTVDPDLQLRLTADRALLDAVFALDCYDGAMLEVPIGWSDWEAQGWEIQSVGPPSLVDQSRLNKRPKDGLLTVPLLRRTTGQFELKLQATRPVPDGNEPFDLTLPSVRAPARQPTVLTVTPAENVEIDLVPAEETIVRTGLAGDNRIDEGSGSFSSARSQSWQIESQDHAFLAQLIVHDREVTADSECIVELDQQSLNVTQTVTYDVAWGRLSHLVLLVPEELRQKVLFTTDEGVELRPTWRSSADGAPAEAHLALPEPKRGRFAIEARYLIDLKEKPAPRRRLTAHIPLLQSFEFEFATSVLEVRHGNHIGVAVADAATWTEESSVPLSSRWRAAGPVTGATLNISLRSGDASQEYIVRRALVVSKLDASGAMICRAQFRIDGPVSTIALNAPDSGVEIDAVWWGGEPLSPDRIVRASDDSLELLLQVSEVPTDGGHLLTIDYHRRPQDRPVRWVDWHELPAPMISPTVWTEQTLWVLSVPRDQLLFRGSRRWMPGFRWRWGAFLWSRQPLDQFADPHEWIAGPDGPQDRPELDGGNRYYFSRLGGSDRLAFATMNLPLVVLLGAGLAFLSGLMLLYIPATRNVLTVLALACLVALVALWYPEPVQLLLQPALLGLALALAAALIHRMLNRETPEPLLTLSSPSDFASPASPSPSSVERVFGLSAGSEDPTAVRHAPDLERESVSAPESGSHV